MQQTITKIQQNVNKAITEKYLDRDKVATTFFYIMAQINYLNTSLHFSAQSVETLLQFHRSKGDS